jgi:ubiquinone/menaquinone biosynthesis C-methylase UbiE
LQTFIPKIPMQIDIHNALKNALVETATHPDFRLLDIGCGDGAVSRQLAPLCRRIVSFDPYTPILREAAANPRPDNLSFLACAAEAPCFQPETFDSVLFCQSLHHVPVDAQTTALTEAARVLRPGGRLTIVEPIYQAGLFGKIFALYSHEKEAKDHALQMIRTLPDQGFIPLSETPVRLDCIVESYDALIEEDVRKNPDAHWDGETGERVRALMEKAERTEAGEFLLDYMVRVFSFRKDSV